MKFAGSKAVSDKVNRVGKLFCGILIMALFLALSAAPASAASQQIALKSGFNFISFTVAPSAAPAQLMQTYPDIEDIYLFSAAAGSFLSVQEGSLSSIAAGKGYIVKSKTAVTCDITGSELPVIGNINLKTGFNLVGFSKMPESVTFSVLMSRAAAVSGIYKWVAASGSFVQVIKKAAGGSELVDGVDPQFKAGESYFINASSDTTVNYDGAGISVGGSSVTPPPVVTGSASGRIVYVSGNQIYVMNVDGTSQTKLSTGGYKDYAPCFSPDDSKIAFVSERSGNPEIYTMSSDGSGVAKLTNYNGSTTHFSRLVYSPDGTRLMFGCQGSKMETRIVNASDGSGELVIGAVRSNEYACFSPDGTKIAYASTRPDQYGLPEGGVYTASADGSNEKLIVAGGGTVYGLTFTADGAKLLASARAFWLIPLDGSARKTFDFTSFYISHIDYSGDGKKLLLNGYDGSANTFLYTGSADFLAGASLTAVPASNFTKLLDNAGSASFSHTSAGVTTGGTAPAGLSLSKSSDQITAGEVYDLSQIKVTLGSGAAGSSDVTASAVWTLESGNGKFGKDGSAYKYWAAEAQQTAVLKASYADGAETKTASFTLSVVQKYPGATLETPAANHSFDAAASIAVNQTYECSVKYYVGYDTTTVKYYKFTVPADGPVTFLKPPVTFYIFSAANTSTLSFSVYTDSAEPEKSVDMKAGDYYIKVQGFKSPVAIFPIYIKTGN